MKDITNLPSYLITDPRNPMKSKKTVDYLARVGILPQIIKAVPVSNIPQEQMDAMTYPSVQYSMEHGARNDNEFETTSEISTYLSHVEIWKALSEAPDNNQTILVLEEGATPVDTVNTINRFLTEIDFVDPDWDFLFLGFEKPYGNYQRDLHMGHMTYKVIDMTFGTHAYLINKKGAMKLLSHVFPMVDQLDSYISLMIAQRGVVAYRPSRTFFEDMNNESVNNLNSLKSKMNRLSNRTLTIIFGLILFVIVFLMVMAFRKRE
jgi:GR25 family glycosyltransferase involved in LPS biosynthesis